MISILCPSRARPDQFRRMVESAKATATTPIEVVAYFDWDDASSRHDAWTLVGRSGQPVAGTVIDGPRQHVMTRYWNSCFDAAKGDIVMQGNDDIVFRTPGWSKLVEDAFAKVPDKILMVHPDDGHSAVGTAVTHPFVSRRWVEAVGYFIAPFFSCDYGDIWVNDLAEAIGRKKHVPVLVEHLHFAFGKGEVDQTHRERMDRGNQDNVGKLYTDLAPRRALDVAKLRTAIAGRPRWTIMILTQPSRVEYLKRLRARLDPQLPDALKPHPLAAGVSPIEVLVMEHDPRETIGQGRQALLEKATGEYVSFIDDDDLVAEDFIDQVLPLLDGVDYVGFRVQTYIDGVSIPPTFHALKYGSVGCTPDHHYRDISHLCPVKRELALQVSMEGSYGEDGRWADQMRELKLLKTEHVVDDNLIMYFYYSRSKKSDEDYKFSTMPVGSRRVPPARRIFSAPRRSLPELRSVIGASPSCAGIRSTCPGCGSSLTAPFANGTRCNQCGAQF